MIKKFKKLIFLNIIVLFIFLFGSCSYFIPLTGEQQPQSTFSGEFYTYDEYNRLPIYISPTYDLEDIDTYNDILIFTKEHIIRSNVSITNKISKAFTYETKNGSGFVFLEDDTHYYAITNYHVIDSDDHVSTYEIRTFEDSEYQSATLIASNQSLDLAVLKFLKNNREEVELINITSRLDYRFKNDELVFAIGNPLTLANNVSFGKFKRVTQIENVDYIVIEHSAEIYNGSSGGALVDVDGNLIGVNTWGLEDDASVSFAIPNFVVYNFLLSEEILD
ncbi:MAG: serine protease [Candidatus Izimaplasma sp.]|nr:serine protease [Candidatus Izimaplasma bacterium]